MLTQLSWGLHCFVLWVSVCLLPKRYSIYLLYSYKSTNTDAEGAARHPSTTDGAIWMGQESCQKRKKKTTSLAASPCSDISHCGGCWCITWGNTEQPACGRREKGWRHLDRFPRVYTGFSPHVYLSCLTETTLKSAPLLTPMCTCHQSLSLCQMMAPGIFHAAAGVSTVEKKSTGTDGNRRTAVITGANFAWA